MALIPVRRLNRLSSYMPTEQAQMWGGKRGKGALADYYTTYLEQQAERLPEEYALAEERRMLEEEQGLEEQARKQARRDALISMGIQGVDVGMKAYPYLKGMSTKPVAPPSLSPKIAAQMGGQPEQLPFLSTVATKPATPIVGEAIKPVSSLAELGTKGAFKAGGLGGTAGYAYGKASDKFDWSEKLHKGVKEIGEKEWKRGGAALSGAITGFVSSGFNPVGAVIGGIFGMAGGW